MNDIRQLAEQPTRSQPINSVPPRPLLQLLHPGSRPSWVHALTYCSDRLLPGSMKWHKPFPPPVVVSHCVLSQPGNPRTLGLVANATSPDPKEGSKARKPQNAQSNIGVCLTTHRLCLVLTGSGCAGEVGCPWKRGLTCVDTKKSKRSSCKRQQTNMI